MTRPRALLEGMTLGDWEVVERLLRPPDHTGGHFSTGYLARNVRTGERAFVKAMDLHDAARLALIKGVSVLDEAGRILDDYRFERDLLLGCREARLTRVVVAREHAEVQLDPANPLMSTVGYLLFDLADGDVRQHVSSNGFNLAWNLATLKEITSGLRQLHQMRVAHQDLKPSNVLMYAGIGTTGFRSHNGSIPKIADLGCAHVDGRPSPRGALFVAGDLTYAPVELLYRYIPNEASRRFGTDLYLLGNFATYLFSSTSMTALIEDQLADEFHWDDFHGDYSDVLPEVVRAFAEALDLLSTDIHPEARDEMVDLISRLCHPDPTLRGFWRGERRGRFRQHDLQPFETKFANLAFKAGRGVLKFSQ